MPKFLEQKLMSEYGPNNPGAVYGTLNKLGAMHGNKTTAKGRAMEAKHERDTKTRGRSGRGQHPHQNLGHYLHPAKKR